MLSALGEVTYAKKLPKCRSEPVRVRGADFLRFVYRAEHADDPEPGQLSTITSRLKAGGRVAQVERTNWPAAASHPCHKLRRRSGRRCLCRPARRMALAAKRPLPLPPPRSLRPLRSTNLPDRPPLCAHHAKQPLLCALLTPFPRSPLAFPKIHVILPHRPAHRAWRPVSGVSLTVV
jgi:hypothetical protein